MAPIKNIQDEFSDMIYQPRDYLEYQVSVECIEWSSSFVFLMSVKSVSWQQALRYCLL